MTDYKAIEEEIIKYRDEYKYQVWDPNIGEILDRFDYNEAWDEEENNDQEIKVEEKKKRIRWFIPPYQRGYHRSDDIASQFIESIFLWIPIQYIFVCCIEAKTWFGIADYEIVDGSQRLRTIRKFVNDVLVLKTNKSEPNKWLKKLQTLDWKKFSDLPNEVQTWFLTRRIRVIEIENMTIENRKDMFHRVNNGIGLDAQEKRRWTYAWTYNDFLEGLVKKYDFKNICPLDARMEGKWKHVEFILKFFAFSDEFDNYTSSVTGMLDTYMEKMIWLNDELFSEKIKQQEENFSKMISIIKEYIDDFKRPNTNYSSSQRFEAISVWVSLALAIKQDIDFSWLKEYVFSDDFIGLTTIKWGANNPWVFKARINWVKNFLLWIK